MALLALFGVLGLVIAAVGIYGVMAYIVAQRTQRDRRADGARRDARPRRVDGARAAGALMAAGLAIGTVVAWYASAAVRAFMFEPEPGDPRILAAAVLTLAIAGLLASAIPASNGLRGSTPSLLSGITNSSSNPKLQIPSSNHSQIPRSQRNCQLPNPNPKSPDRPDWTSLEVGSWGLSWDLGVGSGWSLGFGAWDLTPVRSLE